jgi:hypothetical protein
MRRTQWSARLLSVSLALVIMLTALAGASRADPGEEPNLQVEIVGLKAGSKRDVVVRVTNTSDWWSDATRLTVETVSPTTGQRRTFDVPDLNPISDPSTPYQADLVYTLAADCNGQVIKASLSAGTNYMGEKEINLDDNVVQGEACPTGSGAAPASSGQPARGSSPAAGPVASAGGGDNSDAPRTDVSVEWTSGTRETLLVTYALPYDLKVRNDGADIVGDLRVEVTASGIATISVNQPAGSAQDWVAAGLTCPWEARSDGTAKRSVACSGGSLRSGESITLRVFILFTDVGSGSIAANVGIDGEEMFDNNFKNNYATRDVKILRVP